MKNKWLGISIIVLITILTVLAIIKTEDHPQKFLAYESNPIGVMGTTCRLIAVVKPEEHQSASDALASAENIIRKLESEMSMYIEDSELSRLNRHESGIVSVSDDLAEVLRISLDVTESSLGAFDITCSPLIKLWNDSSRKNRVPSKVEISAIWESSNRKYFHQTSSKNEFEKLKSSVSIDLGGIAKGYSIHKALDELKRFGLDGGLVDIGGDTACFGVSTDGPWHYGVVNPFDKKVFARLDVTDKAVCTSGNYQKYFEIDGKRYSHIIDPRNGQPTEKTVSVTVIAENAAYADAWATAASVLGVSAFFLSRKDKIETMIITGSPLNCTVYLSDNFEDYLVSELPEDWKIVYGSH